MFIPRPCDDPVDAELPDVSNSQDCKVLKSQQRYSSYVSIQSCEFNLCRKLEYCLQYLQIKHCFHPMCSREQNQHFLGNWCKVSIIKMKVSFPILSVEAKSYYFFFFFFCALKNLFSELVSTHSTQFM